MSSGGLLLLLGLLTLWAELTPVSSVGRPKFCNLAFEPGPCDAKLYRFYFHAPSNQCEEFLYGGCNGNKNNFKTRDECRYTCYERRGVCPRIPDNVLLPCVQMCANDWDCLKNQKCCRFGCSTRCLNPG
ncbi:kunitz-type serine protease inhibitor-like [Erythrolamprus reginae]|uniref:kunitz-type serine protease inhibitor-like n=1 Tax=Erythrolamprus reginae TaxID=121349 RepID=UPI00396C68B8